MSTAAAVETDNLVAVLRSMADTLRELTRDYPTWSLAEAEVGEVIGHAQQVRQLSHSLTAVLAREADSRGLGADDGLSRTDWLRTHVDGGLDGPEAAAVTRVALAMNEPRWSRLAERVSASEVPVAHAAAIVRFHDDVARIADPDHLAAVVDSMVEACDVLDRRELARLISHARATLKPPAELESEEAGLRLGRSFRKVQSSAGFSVFELRLDPEGAALVESAVDALSAPRPDLCLDGGVGEADPRTPATRRADALLEIVGRGVAAPEGVTRSPRTTLVVTMTLDALLAKVRAQACSTPTPRSLRPRCAVWPARPASSPWCSAHGPRCSTSATAGGCSAPRNGEPSPFAMVAARSRAAPSRRCGARRTTSCTGCTAAAPTSPMEPFCADATTPWSTAEV